MFGRITPSSKVCNKYFLLLEATCLLSLLCVALLRARPQWGSSMGGSLWHQPPLSSLRWKREEKGSPRLAHMRDSKGVAFRNWRETEMTCRPSTVCKAMKWRGIRWDGIQCTNPTAIREQSGTRGKPSGACSFYQSSDSWGSCQSQHKTCLFRLVFKIALF